MPDPITLLAMFVYAFGAVATGMVVGRHFCGAGWRWVAFMVAWSAAAVGLWWVVAALAGA